MKTKTRPNEKPYERFVREYMAGYVAGEGAAQIAKRLETTEATVSVYAADLRGRGVALPHGEGDRDWEGEPDWLGVAKPERLPDAQLLPEREPLSVPDAEGQPLPVREAEGDGVEDKVAALEEALRAAQAQHEKDAASQAAQAKAVEELESSLKVRKL